MLACEKKSTENDGKTKRFFQYVAIDESMLGGSVIRVFKRKYDIDAEPSFDKIVNDEVDFYTHTSLKIGIQEEYWQKIGRNLNVGDTEIFRPVRLKSDERRNIISHSALLL